MVRYEQIVSSLAICLAQVGVDDEMLRAGNRLSAPVTAYDKCGMTQHENHLEALTLNVKILKINNYQFLFVYAACVSPQVAGEPPHSITLSRFHEHAQHDDPTRKGGVKRDQTIAQNNV